ncbi:hypothetical protein DYY67_0375 [Candidatus Nitrosotalea sp. TS]|nr:hypothetical protein [Candidatus Nitrosotalea sp. TS]
MLGLKQVIGPETQLCPDPEPDMMVTWVVAAKAEGIAAATPKTRTSVKKRYMLSYFILDICKTHLDYMTLTAKTCSAKNPVPASKNENKFDQHQVIE